jgi:hypothetical protein
VSSPPAPIPSRPSKPQKQPPTPAPFATLEMLCILMIVLPGVMGQMSSRPVDAAAARNVMMFRLGCTVVGMIGLITIWIVRAIRKKNAPPEVAPPPSPTAPVPLANPWDANAATARRALMVTSSGTRADLWRINVYDCKHNRSVLTGFLVAPLFFGLLISGRALGRGDYGAVAITLGVCLALWVTFILVAYAVITFRRFPRRDTVQFCVNSATAEGFYDETIEKTQFTPWADIRDIREIEGDICVWTKAGKSFQVLRSAFRDTDASRRFYEALVGLWKSGGTQWPSEAVMAEFAPPLPPTPSVQTTMVPPPPAL